MYGSNNWSSINNTGLPRFRSISQYVTESIGIKNLEDNSHNILRKVLYTKCHHRESIRRPSALSLNSISSSTLEYISCKYLRDSSATMSYDAFVTDTKKQKNDLKMIKRINSTSRSIWNIVTQTMEVDQLLKKVVTVLFHFVLDLFSECHQNIDKSNSMQYKILNSKYQYISNDALTIPIAFNILL